MQSSHFCRGDQKQQQQQQPPHKNSGAGCALDEAAASGSVRNCCSCQPAVPQHRQPVPAACSSWTSAAPPTGQRAAGSRWRPAIAENIGGNNGGFAQPRLGRVLFSAPTGATTGAAPAASSACRPGQQCDCSQAPVCAPLPTDPSVAGRAGVAQQALLGLYGPPEHMRHHSGLVALHPTEKKFGYIVPLCVCSCGQFVQGRNGVLLKCRAMLG
ncbi:hypothetical protein BOX15_Mlig007052g3 [Macrostomum lignano]|uniref:Uncharacterized protein n=1 Tax=Macrostomum lignano TaxID=282301 RepID=A0A267EJB0_9PLAT|nr:hypothetical protein BOX15_Mlig007052g2 [Macrostomum lignano]PAA61721.1 hypothetical protein BOX15_Mlig007052g1 [Macrostomum lignano]PAA79910.1 hypothetical protein BOX15_Mlig007052g3 [Macrostomum lignano]